MLARKAEVLVFIGKAATLTAQDESLLDLIHPLAESSLHQFLQQEIGQTLHVEYLPAGERIPFGGYGNGIIADVNAAGTRATIFPAGWQASEILQLKHLPVLLSGLEVRENWDARANQTQTSFDGDTVLAAGEDYWLDLADDSGYSRTGFLRRVGGWPAAPRSVRASYYGGWSADDMTNSGAAGAIKFAALQTVAAGFWKAKADQKSGGAGGYAGESLGKYSYSGAAVAGMTFDVPHDAKMKLQPFRNYRLF
jgi:hypothetical protein